MLIGRIKNPLLRGIADWLVSLAIAVLLFFALREFVFRTAHVDGNSMLPTLEHGDMLILNRFAYVFGAPRVGDIVAFPPAEKPGEFYIKRIVAGSGDTVDLREGAFWVNGAVMEDAFSLDPIRSFGDVAFPLNIEEGHYFVLGDNRNGSQDSRFTSVGTIPGEDMIGRATVRFWPPSRLGMVE